MRSPILKREATHAARPCDRPGAIGLVAMALALGLPLSALGGARPGRGRAGEAAKLAEDLSADSADAATGEIRWSHDTGRPVLSSPAVAAGCVYFGCDDGLLRCLDAATGRSVWSYDASRASFNPNAAIVSAPAVAAGGVFFGSMNFTFFRVGSAK